MLDNQFRNLSPEELEERMNKIARDMQDELMQNEITITQSLIQQHAKVQKAESEKQAEMHAAWLRHLLLISAMLFGVLVSLHGNNSHSLLSRLAFLLSNISLVLGILTTGVASFQYIDAIKRARLAHAQESSNALHELRATDPVSVPSRKIFAICETAGYLFYSFSLLLLSLYVFSIGFG